jgi:hypothetical protein
MRMRLVLLRRRKGRQRPPRSPGRWPEGAGGDYLGRRARRDAWREWRAGRGDEESGVQAECGCAWCC